ncbi:MAG: hypothetical protein NT007_05745 [Candidatus Kapabacteria bacterium]|nr:hypothetical protein [Candidatus Kapabacteria bacterium]
MATANNPRNYNLSDSELCMFTSNLCDTMTRDLSDLAAFGITALAVTNLNTFFNLIIFCPKTFQKSLLYIKANFN